jgi:hypothetical protein
MQSSEGILCIIKELIKTRPVLELYLYCDDVIPTTSIYIRNTGACIKTDNLKLYVSNSSVGKFYLSGYILQYDNPDHNAIWYNTKQFACISDVAAEIHSPKNGMLVNIIREEFDGYLALVY